MRVRIPPLLSIIQQWINFLLVHGGADVTPRPIDRQPPPELFKARLTKLMQFQSTLVALAASLAAAIPQLDIQGNEFYNSKTGEKFQVVGVAYQPNGSAGFTDSTPDPLSNPEACLRDAALMQVMGINAIRVYNLNPNENHDECASIFNAVSIFFLRTTTTSPVGPSADPSRLHTTRLACT